MTLVVSDASPLIALINVGQADLLTRLFDRVVVPGEVAREVGDLPEFVHVLDAPETLGAQLSVRLDRGEAEAIALAESLSARLLIDERKGRAVARGRGLSLIGTVGVLVEASRLGHVASVQHELSRLRAAGFRISPALEADAIRLSSPRPDAPGTLPSDA